MNSVPKHLARTTLKHEKVLPNIAKQGTVLRRRFRREGAFFRVFFGELILGGLGGGGEENRFLFNLLGGNLTYFVSFVFCFFSLSLSLSVCFFQEESRYLGGKPEYCPLWLGENRYFHYAL